MNGIKQIIKDYLGITTLEKKTNNIVRKHRNLLQEHNELLEAHNNLSNQAGFDNNIV